MADYVQRVNAELYDGSNAAHITEWVQGIVTQFQALYNWTLESIVLDEETDQITITIHQSTLPTIVIVGAGQWLVFLNGVFTPENDDVFQANKTPIPEEAVVSAFGVAEIPAISLVNPTIAVVVNLSREFAGVDDYRAEVFLVGARSMLSVNPVVARVDGNTVRVQVTASLAYVSGAQVQVMAHGRLPRV